MERGLGLAANTADAVIDACARECEQLGYASFWVNHPGHIDGLGLLGGAGRATGSIELGVGVIPLQTREPASIVEGVRDNDLPLDRLLLGVGSPNPRSLTRVREGVAALRVELSCRIIVAALGPKMCRLAGEVSDGVLLNWVTPAHARHSAGIVREGAAAAGREPPKVISYVRLALGAGARERLEEEGGRYARVPYYGANFERMGATPLETAIAATSPDDVERSLGEWAGAVDEVVLRVVPGGDSLEEHLELVRAGAPG